MMLRVGGSGLFITVMSVLGLGIWWARALRMKRAGRQIRTTRMIVLSLVVLFASETLNQAAELEATETMNRVERVLPAITEWWISQFPASTTPATTTTTLPG